MAATAVAPRLDQVTALLDLGLRACSAFDRSDLAPALLRAKERLADPAAHVVVVGEFKQGKSSLVNGLTGANVCPVDDDIATAMPTYLRHGERAEAALLYQASTADGFDRAVRCEPIALAQLRPLLLERAEAERADELAPSPAGRVVGAQVRLPAPLLAGGLVLVDTPGVGGLGSAHASAALAAASLAHALVFVTDASQELTRAELDFLNQARQLCPRVICVLTKTDLYPQWRRIRDLTREHLQRAGIDAPVIAVSSPLRTMALRADDAAVHAESGYPVLLQTLSEQVGGDARQGLARDARADLVAVCTQLEAQFTAERAALADPEQAQRVVAELTEVQLRVQALKSAASNWNRTLADGIADLSSDIDHDLRRRIRDVLNEATEAIELSDPADTWGEMETWLRARVAQEMLANFTWMRQRAAELSERVGEHFREASGEVLSRIAVADPHPRVAREEVSDKIDLDRMGLRRQAMTVLKSGYGGTIMFVMLGTLLGVTLGPIAIGIALVMGTKGLKDEKKRQKEARQRQAVAAVRQYVDQISFVMGKDSRDTLREVQRQLRDHYSELAEQLDRSNSEALRRANEAAKKTDAERKRRLADVDAELGRLKTLRDRAAA